MNIELVNRIKRITLIAMASDDELVETLVLKGGNAIELAYFSTASKISRTSYDLDYSIENGDFTEPEEEIALRLKSTLERTFMEHGFVVIDFKFFLDHITLRLKQLIFGEDIRWNLKLLRK